MKEGTGTNVDKKGVKVKKNKKLSKVNKPYLNKGGKVRNYQDEVDNEY